ncbi:MAG: response regulator [Fibrobacteres bacterium]|nr:response regulator [Fibrobacterota bacterium]
MNGNASSTRVDSKVVLALTGQPEVAHLLREMLVGFGQSLEQTADVGSFKELVAQLNPDLILIDLSLPQAPLALRNLDDSNRHRPILALADPHQRSEMFEAKRLGVFAVLYLPLDPDEACFHFGHALTTLAERFDPSRLGYQERLLTLGNDFSMVTPVALSLVETSLALGDPRRTSVSLGLVELLTNAIEHGNLGISFEEKRDALRGSVFYDLARERSRKSPWKDRVVHARCMVDPSAGLVRYDIQDEGGGFDWRNLPDPFHQNNIGARHGRGILMARHAFQKLCYNDAGNQVFLELPLSPIPSVEDR